MILSHRYKFIFIKTRKTAGTSIEVYLSQFTGANDVVTPISSSSDDHHPQNYRGLFNPFIELTNKNLDTLSRLRALRDFIIVRRFYNHIPAFRVRSRIDPEIWNTYFKFCVERNPWEKTLSHYYFKKYSKHENYTFAKYLTRKNFCLNYPLYMDESGKEIIVDRVLRYENLDLELTDVFTQLGIPFTGRLNVREKTSQRKIRQPYWEVLTQEQIDILTDVFTKEINLHGYEPRQT